MELLSKPMTEANGMEAGEEEVALKLVQIQNQSQKSFIAHAWLENTTSYKRII